MARRPPRAERRAADAVAGTDRESSDPERDQPPGDPSVPSEVPAPAVAETVASTAAGAADVPFPALAETNTLDQVAGSPAPPASSPSDDNASTGGAAPEGVAASRSHDGNGSAADSAGAGYAVGRGRRGSGRRGPALARVDGELHARVDGREHEVVPLPNGDGPRFISDREATTLRTRDYFPRLPSDEWATHRPYVVTLDICVDTDGSVLDATLRSSASETLDAIVLSAARTWRYRPLVVNGRAEPFCHRVVIRYDRW